MKKVKSLSRKKLQKGKLEPLRIREDAAGIDVGAEEMFVAVPPHSTDEPVRSFSTFTGELHRMADWLVECGVRTVAMESTGVYWIPAFQILEARGLEVCLVNAQHAKNVPGRKTDVMDCQWLQQLHSMGLLHASFRPPDQVCVVRSLMRHRESLVQSASQQVLRMQKSLDQMNLHLHHVMSDITGKTGLAILDAIFAGQRDPKVLAKLRDRRIKASEETVAQALEGDYRHEHLFTLKQSLAGYRFVQAQVTACDEQIAALLKEFKPKVDPDERPLPPLHKRIRKEEGEQRERFHCILGVDLTRVDGIGVGTIGTLISEVGPDFSRFRSGAAMASWAGLSPNRQVSGGKVQRSKTKDSEPSGVCLSHGTTPCSRATPRWAMSFGACAPNWEHPKRSRRWHTVSWGLCISWSQISKPSTRVFSNSNSSNSRNARRLTSTARHSSLASN